FAGFLQPAFEAAAFVRIACALKPNADILGSFVPFVAALPSGALPARGWRTVTRPRSRSRTVHRRRSGTVHRCRSGTVPRCGIALPIPGPGPGPGSGSRHHLPMQLAAAGGAALQHSVAVADIADAAPEAGERGAVLASVRSTAARNQRVTLHADIVAAPGVGAGRHPLRVRRRDPADAGDQ